MEVGELVAVVVGDADRDECPFAHRPKQHDAKNVIPPPETANDATKLSGSLDGQSLHLEKMEIPLGNDKVIVHFSAHHLIPGNETWPKTKLYKWMDKREGHVCGDIGYDVNDYKNGVDLPANAAVPDWKAKMPSFQRDYAFAAMLADGQGRQFHDRHPAYSDFVVKSVDKIADKLEAKDVPGCGKKDCGGAKQKPYDPPYGVLPRLVDVAGRLREKLRGFADKWEKPIMTSRFALMLKFRAQGMTQMEARQQLSKSMFKYG